MSVHLADSQKPYSVGKTLAKGVEPPTAIGAGAVVIMLIAKAFGIEVEPEAAGAVAALGYGLFKAIRNRIKNRDRS